MPRSDSARSGGPRYLGSYLRYTKVHVCGGAAHPHVYEYLLVRPSRYLAGISDALIILYPLRLAPQELTRPSINLISAKLYPRFISDKV